MTRSTSSTRSGGLFSSANLDKAQNVLTVPGFTPVGVFADVVNAGISALRGDYGEAGVSLHQTQPDHQASLAPAR